MTLTIILLSVLCLAYANGANDNFKGVATLFGSGTTNYRSAVAGGADWRTIGKILTAWITTLPLGAALGATCYWLMQSY